MACVVADSLGTVAPPMVVTKLSGGWGLDMCVCVCVSSHNCNHGIFRMRVASAGICRM